MADASVVAVLFPLPFAGKNVRTTSEKKRQKRVVGSGWLGWIGLDWVGLGWAWRMKTAQMHRAYKSTRSETLAPAQGAHVLHLLGGNLHALGSHQQQIAAGFSFLSAHSHSHAPVFPFSRRLYSFCTFVRGTSNGTIETIRLK